MVQYGQNKTPGAGVAAGAAGRAVEGFYDLRSKIRDQKVQEQLARDEILDQSRRIDLAERHLGLAYKQFNANQEERARRENERKLKAKDAQSSAKTALQQLMIATQGTDAVAPNLGEGWGGFPGMTPIDPVKAVLDVGQQAASQAETPEAAANIARSTNIFATKAVMRQASEDLANEIKHEVATGYWQEAQGGDANKDGQPDPLAETPTHLLEQLKAGVDPRIVATQHAKAKDAWDTQRAVFERRQEAFDEVQQQVAALGPAMKGADAIELKKLNSKWARGEIKNESDYREEALAVATGKRALTLKIGGAQVKGFYPAEQVAQVRSLAMKQAMGEAADLMQRQAKMKAAVSRMLGPYHPTITTTNDAGKRVTVEVSPEEYLAKFNAIGRDQFPNDWDSSSGTAATPRPGNLMQQAEDAAAQGPDAWKSFSATLPQDVNLDELRAAVARGKARGKK